MTAAGRAAPGDGPLTFVQWLDTPQDRPDLGGKAGPLATLLAAGLPVPPGFVVSPRAFRDLPLAGSAREDLLRPQAMEEIRRSYRTLARRLRVTDPPVAVRSSATAEDLAGASFAGQYATYLHVRGAENVVAYTARCAQSLYSEHAQAYRRHHEQRTGTALPPPAMAVLVQALVEAEAAGVAFTAHPTTGANACVQVNACWGLGQSIVDGAVEADTYLVERHSLAVSERHVGRKATRTGEGPAAARAAVPEHLQQAPCLTTAQAAAVAQLALATEAVVGGPADVEWALRDGTVWLLQARPITTLAARPLTSASVPDGEAQVADRSNNNAPAASAATDGAPDTVFVGATAAFPFAWPDEQAPKRHWQLGTGDRPREAVLRPLEQEVRAVGYRAVAAAAFLCGRPRYRVAWYVNGYEYTADIANPRPESEQALCREALDQVGAALAERGESYRRAVQFPSIDAGNARRAAVDVEGLAPTELAAHLDDALRWFEQLWTQHWIGTQDSPVRRFLQLYTQHFGKPGSAGGAPSTGAAGVPSEQVMESEARTLLTHEPNLLTEAIDGLLELARTVQGHAALRDLFQSKAAAAVLEALPRTPGGDAQLVQLDRLLERQGLRCGAGFGTERPQVLPGWREQPALVLELVQRYLPHDLDSLVQARRTAIDERDRRVAELRALLPDETTRAAFTFWLTAARRQQQAFEDHNYKIDSASNSLLHRAVAACARRLVTSGVLATEDEVWWLNTEEIRLALDALGGAAADAPPGERPSHGTAATIKAGRSHWPTLIAARQAHDAWCRLLSPPTALGTISRDRSATSGAGEATKALVPVDDAGTAVDPALPPHVLVRGKPGSRGVATGRVRLVSPEALAPEVTAGDVLVAHNAGPLWTPLFPLVAAVVLDEGDLFQHAMLTCREYGLPAVFQTKDGTRRLHEGQRVTVDGTRGQVVALDGVAGPIDGSRDLSR